MNNCFWETHLEWKKLLLNSSNNKWWLYTLYLCIGSYMHTYTYKMSKLLQFIKTFKCTPFINITFSVSLSGYAAIFTFITKGVVVLHNALSHCVSLSLVFYYQRKRKLLAETPAMNLKLTEQLKWESECECE